jgi:hypothetical protein
MPTLEGRIEQVIQKIEIAYRGNEPDIIFRNEHEVVVRAIQTWANDNDHQFATENNYTIIVFKDDEEDEEDDEEDEIAGEYWDEDERRQLQAIQDDGDEFNRQFDGILAAFGEHLEEDMLA